MIEKPPKRKRSAWFAFYPDDFAGGTRGMSLAAKGAFIDLLAYQFANGSIPLDDRTLCRIIGAFPEEWHEIRAEVLCKFEDENGMLVNRRMQKERDERNEIREKRIQAVNKRWNKTDTLVCDLNKRTGYKSNDLVYTSPSPSPSPSLTKKKEEEGATRPAASALTKSEILSGEGKFLEALSVRIDKSVDDINGITNGMKLPEGCFDAYLRNRAAEDWRTKARTPIGPFTWHADLERFAAAWARNKENETVVKAPKPRKRLPANWRETAESLWGHPVQCNEDDLTPDQWGDIYRNSKI